MRTVVCISDLHNRTPELPQGDILLVAGDLTQNGTLQEVIDMQKWLQGQKHKFDHVVVVPGNHDKYIAENPQTAKSIMGDLNLLINESIMIDGLKIWGSPYMAKYETTHNAFFLEKTDMKKFWKKIPEDVDYLITHVPPMGTMDTFEGKSHGCIELMLRSIQLAQKPKLHLFGHVHSKAGKVEKNGILHANCCYAPSKEAPSPEILILRI